LKAAAFKLPVGRIAGSFAGNNTPPDGPAGMLHLEPGKISGRGAAHGIDSTAQMPRRASPARRHNARVGTSGALIRAAAGQVSATMLLTHLDLRAGHDGQPGGGGVAACRSGVSGNIVPAVPGVQPPAAPAQPATRPLAGLSGGQNPAAIARCHWPATQPLIPAPDPSPVAAAPPARDMPLRARLTWRPALARWLQTSDGCAVRASGTRLGEGGTGVAAGFWDGEDKPGAAPWRSALTAPRL
jgi:hypothetical protein